MIPIREVVIFPYMMTPFVVGRESSLRALKAALASNKKIFLATQHDCQVDEPRPDETYAIGTVANIVQSLTLPDGNIKMLVEGVERGRAVRVIEEEGYFRTVVETFDSSVEGGPEIEILTRRVTRLFERYITLSLNSNYPAIRLDEPGKLADTVCANLQSSTAEKQKLLEIFDPIDRLARVAEILELEIAKPGAGHDQCRMDTAAVREDETDCDDPVKVYLREVQKVELTGEEEADCVRHIRAKDEQADWCEKTLVEANLHIVVSIAERYQGGGIHILDLIQSGNAGLVEALKAFAGCDADSFPVYALPYIERAIAQAVSVQSLPPG